MIGLHVDLMIHRHQEALARTKAQQQHGNAPREKSTSSLQSAPARPQTLNSQPPHRGSYNHPHHSHEASFPHPEAGTFASSSLKPDFTDPLQSGSASSPSFHQQFEPLSSSYSSGAPASVRHSVDNFPSYGIPSGDAPTHSLGMHQSQYLGSSAMMDDVDDVPDLFSSTDLQSAPSMSAAYSFLGSSPPATLDDDVVLHRGVSSRVVAAAAAVEAGAPSSLSTFSSPSSLSCGGDESSSISPVVRTSERMATKASHLPEESHSLSSRGQAEHAPLIDTSRPTHLDRFVKSDRSQGSREDLGSAGEFPRDLWDACRRGSTAFVEFFLRDNPSLNDNTTAESLDSDEHSPLFYACAGGHTHVVAMLLDHNPLQLIDPEIECYQRAANSTIRSLLDEHLRWQVARDDEYFVEWSNAHSGDRDSDDVISLDSASDGASIRSDESENVEEGVRTEGSVQEDAGDDGANVASGSGSNSNAVSTSGDIATSGGDLRGIGVGEDNQ